jgi:hypothetical protein
MYWYIILYFRGRKNPKGLCLSNPYANWILTLTPQKDHKILCKKVGRTLSCIYEEDNFLVAINLLHDDRHNQYSIHRPFQFRYG